MEGLIFGILRYLLSCFLNRIILYYSCDYYGCYLYTFVF